VLEDPLAGADRLSRRRTGVPKRPAQAFLRSWVRVVGSHCHLLLPAGQSPSPPTFLRSVYLPLLHFREDRV